MNGNEMTPKLVSQEFGKAIIAIQNKRFLVVREIGALAHDSGWWIKRAWFVNDGQGGAVGSCPVEGSAPGFGMTCWIKKAVAEKLGLCMCESASCTRCNLLEVNA